MKLWVKILLSLFSGVIVGLSVHEGFLPQVISDFISPIGTIFLNLISMIIVPLVFSSMTIGITSIHDPQKLGRVGLKSLFLYLITTMIAIAVGVIFAKFFEPGVGVNLQASTEIHIGEAPSFKEIILSIIPVNPIASMVEGNVLQIIVFALFFGIAINFAGEKGKAMLDVVESLSDIMYRLTSIIMEFSPIGVFAIMVGVTSSFGYSVLPPLLKLVGTYYAACLFQAVVVFCSMLYFFARLNPWPFFKGMSDALMMGFSTCSSSATLPVTIHCAQQNLGVSKNIANFVLPLGSTINMNGAAIFQSMSAVFIAQVYLIDLGWQSLLTIILTATLSSIGAAGIPGSGLIMLSVVFASVGLPIEGIALLAGIDRIREMVSTMLNILSDTVCAVYVAKMEGELDERQYNHASLVDLEGSEI